MSTLNFSSLRHNYVARNGFALQASKIVEVYMLHKS